MLKAVVDARALRDHAEAEKVKAMRVIEVPEPDGYGGVFWQLLDGFLKPPSSLEEDWAYAEATRLAPRLAQRLVDEAQARKNWVLGGAERPFPEWKGRPMPIPIPFPEMETEEPPKKSVSVADLILSQPHNLYISLRDPGSHFSLDIVVKAANKLPVLLKYPECLLPGNGAGISYGEFLQTFHLRPKEPKDRRSRFFKLARKDFLTGPGGMPSIEATYYVTHDPK